MERSGRHASLGQFDHSRAEVDRVDAGFGIERGEYLEESAVAIAEHQDFSWVSQLEQECFAAAAESASEGRVFQPAVPAGDRIAVQKCIPAMGSKNRGLSRATSARTRRASREKWRRAQSSSTKDSALAATAPPRTGRLENRSSITAASATNPAAAAMGHSDSPSQRSMATQLIQHRQENRRSLRCRLPRGRSAMRKGWRRGRTGRRRRPLWSFGRFRGGVARSTSATAPPSAIPLKRSWGVSRHASAEPAASTKSQSGSKARQ